jgi:lysozyme family protein
MVLWALFPDVCRRDDGPTFDRSITLRAVDFCHAVVAAALARNPDRVFRTQADACRRSMRHPMAASSFNQSLRRLLAHEGGYTNHPSDPGGPTNFGITLADYRRHVKSGATAADVRAMRVEEAMLIYKAKYWDALRSNDLPAGVDDSVFDYGVNSGIARSGKVLRRVLGLSDGDWSVTADVLAALATRDPKAVIVAINDERLRFLQSLKTWPVFGAGWARRVKDVRACSMALAEGNRSSSASNAGRDIIAANSGPPASGKGQIAAPSGAQAGATGGAAIAGGAAATHAQQSGADPMTLALIVLAAPLTGATVWLAFRWWRGRRQERALPGTAVVPETA